VVPDRPFASLTDLMTTPARPLAALALAATLAAGCAGPKAIATEPGERWLSHAVYFDLADDSPAACAQLEADCWDLLSELPGIRFFATGTLASSLDREVNDRGFDVALHVCFETRADHDVYQVSKPHQELLARYGDKFAGVRVFDSWVEARAPYQGF